MGREGSRRSLDLSLRRSWGGETLVRLVLGPGVVSLGLEDVLVELHAECEGYMKDFN